MGDVYSWGTLSQLFRSKDLNDFVREVSPVSRWLNRVPGYRKNVRFLYDFWVHLRGQPCRFEGMSLGEALEVQGGLSGREQYELLDVIQDYILHMIYGTKATKDCVYASIRSFFLHNRCELPRDKIRFHSDYDPVVQDLSLDEFKAILREANILYRSAFLIKFQAMMGLEELVWFSNNAWPAVEEQLKKGSSYLKSHDRIILHIPKRKGVELPFFTSIERDGREALLTYLKKWRGPIRPGEPIYLNNAGNPLTKDNLGDAWMRCSIQAGVVTPKTPKCAKCGGGTLKKRKRINRKQVTRYFCTECGEYNEATQEYLLNAFRNRYGKGSHEGCRDLTRSLWEKTPAKAWVAEFRLGHPVDVNNYQRLMKKDPEWGEEQFELAAPWLNILSEDPEVVPRREVDQRSNAQDQKIEVLTEQLENYVKLAGVLADRLDQQGKIIQSITDSRELEQ